MAQPAVTKNPLGISPFWQKASAAPPIEWEKGNQQLFLGIIAKDGIDLSKLLRDPPAIRRPQEPGYELPIDGETNVQIRDRNLRNQEKKVTWENQCAHLDNLSPTVVGVPWDEADIQCISYNYLCLGAEGQRRVSQYYLDLRIQEVTTRNFCDRLKRLFVKERNVTFVRNEAFTRKQGKTESLEQYHCGLTELVVKGKFKCVNCNDGRLETEIIRDLFTANKSNDEMQEDLLAETKTPEQALDYAIRREQGLENQILIRKQGSAPNTPITTVKSQPVGFIAKRKNNNNNRYSSRGGRQRQQSQQQHGYAQRQPTDQKQQSVSFKCGNPFGPGHLQKCPAKDKICNKCTKRGHYARLCKSSEVNAIQEDQAAEQISQDTDVAAYVNYMQASDLIPGWELIHPDNSTTNSIRFESKSVNQIDEFDLKGHLVRVQCGQNDLVFRRHRIADIFHQSTNGESDSINSKISETSSDNQNR